MLRVVARSRLVGQQVVAAVRLLVFQGRALEMLTLRRAHAEADRRLVRPPDTKTGQKVL